MHRRLSIALLAATGCLLVLLGPARAQTSNYYFAETQHNVAGRFLEYWQQNGGLAQHGYPVTEQFQEVSTTDGKGYTVQYFERAVFELHPENTPTNDVLLSRLGARKYQARYPNGAPDQIPNTSNPRYFRETGKVIGGRFRQYWEANGGLAQQGFPLSDEFQEATEGGKINTVQYFERAVFEYHPENLPPNDVLLSLLGRSELRRRYPDNSNPAALPAQPLTGKSPQPVANARQQAYVMRVVDGDTIVVKINGQEATLRYIGINTPETVAPNSPVGCFGPEASAANKALVAGKAVELEKDVSETDRFGRLLRYVYVGGIFVNAELVSQGYAQVSTFPPDVKYQQRLLQLEHEARAAGRGLWGPACQQPAATATHPPASSAPTATRPSSGGGGVCGTNYDPNGSDRDCSDFASHTQAQCFFEAAGGPTRDPHQLDDDNDGIACENLP